MGSKGLEMRLLDFLRKEVNQSRIEGLRSARLKCILQELNDIASLSHFTLCDMTLHVFHNSFFDHIEYMH